jgi:localization factor PodJL
VLTKAQFPDQGRPNSESPEDKREAGHREENLPNAEEPRDENRGVDQDSIWRSIAALSKSRIESQLGEQPSANARPIRNALAELESRLARLSREHRGADVEMTLRGQSASPKLRTPGRKCGARGRSEAGHVGPLRRIALSAAALDRFRHAGFRQLSRGRRRARRRSSDDRQSKCPSRTQDVAQAIGELAPRIGRAIETAMGDPQGIGTTCGVPDETRA